MMRETKENRTEDFLDSLRQGNSPVAEKIRKEAIAKNVPVIRRETEDFLKAVLSAVQPSDVLEVGTAVGYSAIVMSEILPDTAHITTIENYEPRILAAEKNLRRAGAGKKITLVPEEAGKVLKKLETSGFDLIFMDAAKGQYAKWFPDLLRILRVNGVLISDNVLQEGTLQESRFAVDRRDRTIHERMREYLFTLTHTEGLVTAVLPIGDGVSMSVKKKGIA